MSELFALALRLNLAASAAVIVALVLRLPARRLFGARVAYGLWSLVPLAALSMLLPTRVVPVAMAAPMIAAPMSVGSAAAAWAASAPAAAPASHASLMWVAAWLIGAAIAAARLAARQARFVRAEQAGTAGPAAVGVLRPRIVLPADFAQRYSARERELVLAHEAAHLARHDTRVNAATAILRCLAWFNPLAHVMAHAVRIDQELACDARVVAGRPKLRRAYAQAMLKTQLALTPLPLGSYWPSSGPHPLARRIAMLARPAPGAAVRALGAASVGLTALAVGWCAWAARPPEFVWVSAPGPAAAEPAPLIAPVAHDALKPSRPQAPAARAPTVAARRETTPAAEAQPAQAAKGLVTQPASAPSPPAGAAVPPEGCGQDDTARLPKGDFGPARRIRAFAGQSVVQPGQAVRVYARTTDAEGATLITDLTAFGSQRAFRLGCIRRNPSPDSLYTSVLQHGDRFVVQLSIRRDERWVAMGQGEFYSGETHLVRLDDGRMVDVSVVARAETPEELDRTRLARWPLHT
jgi:beta-lactamase regulating signal transducer with metallopeptidase domain